MFLKYRAHLVHLLTATGAIFAMLALLSAAQQNWPQMFLWLVVAFAVDGVDGPLARAYQVNVNAPRFDGVLLDLIIDYLTYVFIPAFALFRSGLLHGVTNWAAVTIICFLSALYFADTRMKTSDNSFHGFPGCWNMLILVFFAVQPPEWVVFSLVVVLSIAMFLPLKFIHPVRTERWRSVSLAVALAWTGSAGWAAWHGFADQALINWLLVATSLYLLGVGIVQQLLPDPA